ncbi:hypothetical protein D3C76_1085590 [compost metagenome]
MVAGDPVCLACPQSLAGAVAGTTPYLSGLVGAGGLGLDYPVLGRSLRARPRNKTLVLHHGVPAVFRDLCRWSSGACDPRYAMGGPGARTDRLVKPCQILRYRGASMDGTPGRAGQVGPSDSWSIRGGTGGNLDVALDAAPHRAANPLGGGLGNVRDVCRDEPKSRRGVGLVAQRTGHAALLPGPAYPRHRRHGFGAGDADLLAAGTPGDGSWCFLSP